MKIARIITDIASAMKDDGLLASWQYNTPSLANVHLSNLKTPTAVIYAITDRSIDLSTGVVREKANIHVFFVTRNPAISADGMKSEQFVDDMAELGTQFLSRLMSDNTISISDSIQMQSVFNMGDTNAAGVSLQLDVTEIQGTCM